MALRVVLNGGLRSCCSTYPPELVEKILKNWLSDLAEVEVIDRKAATWEAEGAAALAVEYFGESAYPLIYTDGKLVAVGYMPNLDELKDMVAGRYPQIRESDIIEGAKKGGDSHAQ